MLSKPCQGNRCQICTAFISASCVISNSNGRTFHCRNQDTNCNAKWAVYMIMCDVCGLKYVGQTNNIRSRMNGHKSDYRRFLNVFFQNKIFHLFTVIYNLMMLKFSSSKYWKFLKNEGFKYTKDICQLETSLGANERHLIWKLETLTQHGLNVAATFYSQNRSSRNKRSRVFTFVSLIHIYMHISLCRFVCICMHVHT